MTHPKKETFSQRLRRARLSRGLSQYDLADLTGFSQRMIVHYEKHSKKLSPAIILSLAKALKVSANELLGHTPLSQKDPLVKNRHLFRKLKDLDRLPAEDQKTIIRHIDDLSAKYETKLKSK